MVILSATENNLVGFWVKLIQNKNEARLFEIEKNDIFFTKVK